MYMYKITNNIDSKIYIGVTVNAIEKRFSEHCNSKYRIGLAIRKHGAENFTIETIKQFDSVEEMYLEEKNIVTEDFVKSSKTYNSMIGGHGGNTLINYTEEEKAKHSEIKSNAIQLMWDNMPKEERIRRGQKTKANMSKEAKESKSNKISKARKIFFSSETEEEKAIRISKAVEGAKKIEKKECQYCFAKITPSGGNFSKHLKSCYDNPSGTRYNKRPTKRIQKEYILTSPDGTSYIKQGNVRAICEELNISSYLLLKEVGTTIKELNKFASPKNVISSNTIGWKLDIIS